MNGEWNFAWRRKKNYLTNALYRYEQSEITLEPIHKLKMHLNLKKENVGQQLFLQFLPQLVYLAGREWWNKSDSFTTLQLMTCHVSKLW